MRPLRPYPAGRWLQVQPPSSRQTRGRSQLRAAARLQRLKDFDVVVVGIVPVTALGHVLNQMADDGLDVIMGMEAQNVFCALNRYFVVSDVLDVPDVESGVVSELLTQRGLDQVGDLAHSVVAGCDVKDAGNRSIRLDGANVSHGRVVDAQNRAPGGGVVDPNHAVLHGAFEHGINDQIEAHAWAVAGDSALAQGDDGKVAVDELNHSALTLQLGNPIGVRRGNRAVFVEQFIFRVAVHRAGTGIDVTMDLGLLGDVRQVGRRGRVEHEILAGRKLSHGVVGEPGQENHLRIVFQVIDLEVENVAVDNANFGRKRVSEPEQVHDVNVVTAFQQFWYKSGTKITGAAGYKNAHAKNSCLEVVT